MNQSDAELLRWYYSDAKAVVLRSHTGALLDKLRYELPSSISTSGDSFMTDQLLEQIEKLRELETLLSRLSQSTNAVLRAYYGDQPSMLGAFREYGGLSLLTPTAGRYAPDQLVTLRAISMTYLSGDKSERKLVNKILRECIQMLDQALEEWDAKREYV
jgi:hypothetical protein